jgi:hypothetical protein
MRTAQRIIGLLVGGRALALMAMTVVLMFLTFSGAALASSVDLSPVITGLEPNHGPTSGGTTVTIHGEPLENARSVHFGTVEGKILHEECGGVCEIAPYRTLVVESPPHAAGTIDVTVETAQGVSVASPGDEFTYGPSGGPSIESESVSNITPTDATLEAQIDTEVSYTGYWFQIDTNSSYDFTQADCPFEFPGYAECDSIRVGEPLPAGLVEPRPEYIQASSGDQPVRLDLAGIGTTLQPATTYHYRVLAANGGSPTVQGPDQTFTTPGAQSGTGGGQSIGGGQTVPGGTDRAICPNNDSLTGCAVADLYEPKPHTRTQKLAKALEQCGKEPKRRRAKCEKQAHKQYGAVAKKRKQ